MRDPVIPKWLFWVNFCVLQWFVVRLALKISEQGSPVGWKLQPRLPLTGWNWGAVLHRLRRDARGL